MTELSILLYLVWKPDFTKPFSDGTGRQDVRFSFRIDNVAANCNSEYDSEEKLIELSAHKCNGPQNIASLTTSDIEVIDEDDVEILQENGEDEEVEEVDVGPQERIGQVCEQELKCVKMCILASV